MGHTILVTGATGFLGSALCAGLSGDHKVVGLYRRLPSYKLKAAAPSASWMRGDVSDAGGIHRVFKQMALKGTPIDYVIHFAAYTGFGAGWEDEYTHTNVMGTRNIIDAAYDAGVKRILFAGSIAALEPPGPGQVLTENSPPKGRVAYARSKALGEQMLYENAARIPAVVLRLGGVFTDWCELPPLFSLIKLWHKPFWGRMIPGRGESGFPYIHRRDVVALVRQIIEKNEVLDRFEVLLGAHSGTTSQRELFPVIRRACHKGGALSPVNVPLPLARLVLHAKYAANTLRGKNTYERAWMLDYADRPLVVDTEYTTRRLGWAPDPGRHILERLPTLMTHFNAGPQVWKTRNINRNDQKYEFDPDSLKP